MCFPHVVNICCQHVIQKCTDIELVDAPEQIQMAAHVGEPQSHKDAVKRDPIARGRNVVHVIRSSGQRRDAFAAMIKSGNEQGLQLLRDVKTRWDSVYYMIRHLHVMHPVVDYFLVLNRELGTYRLSEMEWSILQDFEVILKVPHRVQQAMSGETIPILAGAIPAFELFMMQWEDLGKKHLALAPLINIGLKYATKYYDRMDRTRSYIITMVLNPTIRMSWICTHWDLQYISKAEQAIKDTMAEYRVVMDMQFATPETAEEQTIEQEFQSFVMALLSPKGTNTLKFWESSEAIHPTLFDISLDYLPIQASTVPSEQVFSSSAETNMKKCNHINPVLMEALRMLKFGLKKACLDLITGWMTREGDLLDREPEGDLLGALLGNDHQNTVDKIIQNICKDDDDLP